ncbi:DNA polymerase IV [Candidatus Curtissbacteria bacterium]|nr:DNA polymerase IV [Candidatus Curtissbacteria bacterium]
MNSFFATAEQQTQPELRGKPVGVIKAKGRTCIIAASVEAKKFGVGTGSRTYDAFKLCPQIILVPADFPKYEAMSYKFIDICQSYSPDCEVFSLDECFIDVTETEKFWGNAFNIACEIKDRLRKEVGDYMTCSIGISHNRMLAKLAAEQIKPDGLFWITDDNKLEVLDRSNLMDVCGLGYGLYRHLTKLGIDSFPALRDKTMRFLQEEFGPFWSVHLYNLARGIDDSPLTPIDKIADAKSVGRTYTTHRNLYKKAEIERLIRNLAEEAAAKARQMNLAGRYVGLCLRGEVDGTVASRTGSWGQKESWYGHMTLKNYIDDGKNIFDICVAIAKNWRIHSVRFCGVTLGMLTKKDYLPSPLFASDRKRVNLIKAIDKINSKWGDYTLYPGQLLGTNLIMPEVNGFFGDRKYRLGFV